MSIILNDNLQSESGKSLDNKYLKDGVTPYADINEVNTTIPLTYRSKGLTVLIGNQEYWYKDGVADNNLVPKSPSDFCSINLHKDVSIGNDVNFVHTNGGSEVDNIDTDVAITRASAQPIYNPILDPVGWVWANPIMPSGTLWNADGWGDLSNVADRVYLPFYDALNFQIGNNVVGAELVMKDTVNNKYYKFNFTQWTQGGGGTPATNQLDRTNSPADGTIVTISGVNQYQYNLANNEWTRLRDNAIFTLLDDAINTDDYSQVNIDYNSPIATLTANVSGVSGNTITTTVSPIQVGFGFANPTMSGATGGGGGFAYTRNLITVLCSGKIIFDDGSEMDTAPVSNQNIILVDDVFGDDANAEAYNMNKPFKTVNKAIQEAVDGDLIWINPSPNDYVATNSLFYYNTSKALSYYISKGATLVSTNGTNLSVTGKDVSIYGEGNFVTYNFNINTANTGNILIDVNNLTIVTTMQFVGSFNANVTIRANKIIQNGIIYYENSGHWAGATSPTNLSISAQIVECNTILFVIYPAYLNLNINVGLYNQSNTVVPAIWNYGGTPTYKVTSYINVQRLFIDRSMGYSTALFNFIAGNNNCNTFITGEYNYIGRGVEGDRNHLIVSDGGCQQNIFFNGVANITNGAFFLDLNGVGKLVVDGKVYVDNPAMASKYFTFSTYFVSSSKVQINADTIISDAFNYLLQMGDYSGSSNVSQVDINSCQLVNKSGVGTEAPTIGKAYNAFGGSTPNWGKLRLNTAKIINNATSIQGGSPNEPVEAYFAFTNTPTVDISNTITLINLGIYTEATITSNEF